jgi:hypothetical protein
MLKPCVLTKNTPKPHACYQPLLIHRYSWYTITWAINPYHHRLLCPLRFSTLLMVSSSICAWFQVQLSCLGYIVYMIMSTMEVFWSNRALQIVLRVRVDHEGEEWGKDVVTYLLAAIWYGSILLYTATIWWCMVTVLIPRKGLHVTVQLAIQNQQVQESVLPHFCSSS